MKFDWDDFRDIENKIVVHCKTEKEAINFCKHMNEHGFKWGNGESYLEFTHYCKYGKDTCYFSNGCFCDYKYYDNQRYKILEWSDYMKTENNEFTKTDLKDAMFVIFRNGEIYVVVGNYLIGIDGWDSLCNYRDDLCNKHAECLDIIKVGKLKSGMPLMRVIQDNLDIIWERKEPQKLTVEDVVKKLKELTGKDYEIA